MNEHIEPVRIILQQSGGGEWWTAALVVTAMTLSLTIGFALWARWRCGRDPLETAFAALARAGGLGASERDELMRLSARSGVPAAALLVSETARGEASRRASARRIDRAA